MGDFAGREVLITGAASGIGRSHALFFASKGALVLAHDRDAERLGTLATSIASEGGRVETIVADAEDGSVFGAALERSLAAHEVDILVNNLGIPADGSVEGISPASFDRAFRINVLSAVIATQAVLPAMKRLGRGKIVLTSSNWALAGQEDSSLYSATKAALLGFTKSWAREFAPWNINVNCIAPGGIKTDLLRSDEERLKRIPLRRNGEPIEVSHLVGFLASNQSNYITGSVLNLNGGELIVGC